MTDTSLDQMLNDRVAAEAADEPDDDPDEFADLALGDVRPARRFSLVTTGLAVALIAVLAFAGGAVVFKRTNGSSPAGLGGARAGAFTGGQGGGLGGFTPGGHGQQAAATTGAATTSTPSIAVVGTVTALGAKSLTVKNLGGTRVTVALPTGTQIITVTTASGTTSLKKGATVSVTGTTAADGAVTASAVTVRSA